MRRDEQTPVRQFGYLCFSVAFSLGLFSFVSFHVSNNFSAFRFFSIFSISINFFSFSSSFFAFCFSFRSSSFLDFLEKKFHSPVIAINFLGIFLTRSSLPLRKIFSLRINRCETKEGMPNALPVQSLKPDKHCNTSSFSILKCDKPMQDSKLK